MFDVVLFEATGTAGPQNLSRYSAGERHSLIIFARQAAGTTPDPQLARSIAEDYGWLHVTISRTALLSVEALNSMPHLVRNYEGALENGHSLVTFREEVE